MEELYQNEELLLIVADFRRDMTAVKELSDEINWFIHESMAPCLNSEDAVKKVTRGREKRAVLTEKIHKMFEVLGRYMEIIDEGSEDSEDEDDEDYSIEEVNEDGEPTEPEVVYPRYVTTKNTVVNSQPRQSSQSGMSRYIMIETPQEK